MQYRDARTEDLPECADLFLESSRDLRARHNIRAGTMPSHADTLTFYEHVHSTGIFRVADVERRIAALACAIVRDHLWFLSGFWARPEFQRKGLGMPLLRSVHQAGMALGAIGFFVWSSVDLTAMAAYMKLGMLLGYPLLSFEGTPRILSSVDSACSAAPLDMSSATDLDLVTLGARRPADHEFWRGMGLQGREVHCRGETIGYYYLDGGKVGPGAWKGPEHAGAVLALACREAAASGSPVRLEVLGVNHAAVRFAVDAGLRLTTFSHILTSAPFGRLEHYLPSGPGLF